MSNFPRQTKKSKTQQVRMDQPNWVRKSDKKMEEAGKRILGALIIGAVAFFGCVLFPPIGGAIFAGMLVWKLAKNPKPASRNPARPAYTN